jgi:hypothetical protein
MLERCPTWGKTIGRLMESDPDEPGVIEILSGEGVGPRIVLAPRAVPAARARCRGDRGHVPLGRAGVSIDRCSLLPAAITTGSSKDVLTRLIFV